ncbi:hypothetical protein NQ314_001415 [Rhamnusium bicolor]|uniref:Uncharacterized protein n=1 Tax=Rhamnusium bicolor TaxID=1586634 RepID=A0AAV8ZRW4_9CUCU|nr:hypothetical protein NQ314_001415 [Rhamnusium bicolor]
MRVFIKQLIIYSKYIHYSKNIHTRHLTKVISADHITQLNEGTLTGRLLIYLNNTYQPVIADETIELLNILKRKGTNKLEKCSTKQMISVLNLLSNRDHIKDRYEIVQVLNVLDNEFCRRLTQLGTKDKLRILYIYMNILPNRIVQCRYYDAALKELFSRSETLDKKDLCQLIFYIGLRKKARKSQYMLRQCIKLFNSTFINNLTTEEICLICNSTFKTSTKINNEAFLNKVINCLNDNLYLLKDPAFFITLIKTVRHNRYQNEDLLATISCTIFFNATVKYYSFSALCHILALYCDYLYYDPYLIKVFTVRCIEQLKSSDYTSKHAYLIEQPRVKDIKRFLWCLSNANYKNLEANDIKNVIIPNIMKRQEAGEFKDDFATLIDFMLYFWMLNYRAYELVPYALTQESIQFIRGIYVFYSVLSNIRVRQMF